MDRRTYDKYVISIAQQGSMTKAAASLGISQPALSLGLTHLENDLGFKIFNRRSIPIRLTPEGKIYLEYINRLQVLSEDFKRRLEEYQSEENGVASIGGPVAYVESLVTDAVIRLRKSHPQYRVEMKCSPLSELIDMAAKGEIECFISTSDELPDRFEKKLIKKEKIYLCIPKQNEINRKIEHLKVTPGKEGECFDYALLNGQTFIFLESHQPMQLQIEEFLSAYGIDAKNKIRVNQVSTAVSLAARGEGVCFASEAALEGNVSLDNVLIYPLPDTISGRNIYIAYDKELFRSAACRTLIGYLLDDNQ